MEAAATTEGFDYREVAYPETYADENRLHAIFADMRRNAPVVWQEPEGYRPFWSITKYDDIVEISRQNELFLNGPRAVLIDSAEEERVLAMTGGGMLLRTLIHMDNPDHKLYRGLTQEWFQPKNVNTLRERIAKLAKQTVDHMAEMGSECDFVTEAAVWYPLRVILLILGAPPEDEAMMLKLTQELFGARDPEMQRELDSPMDMGAVGEFFEYFTKMTEERRANPQDDVASVIANATIDGEPIGHLEAMSYYVITATAGHDTTSSSTSGGMHALIENPDQLAKLKADPSLIPSAVDEMIRWATPVKHFMRTATEDYELRGQTIRKDDAVMLHYPSGNRDEDVFEDADSFKVDRSPNKHIAFGYGAHLCLGQFLAKLEMRALFEELIPRLGDVTLAGEPSWVQAAFVSGLKHLPVRYQLD